MDLDSLPLMIGPRRREALASAAARDALAQVKLKRRKKKPGKSHATNQERSHEERRRAAKRKHEAACKSREAKAYHAAVRAYWLGERDSHP